MMMNRNSILAASVLAVLLAAPATAEPKIGGNYGDQAGCRLAATGNIESDDLLLLTPGEVTTYATGCTFVQLMPGGDIDLVATVICGHEGDETITLGLMRIRKEKGRDAFSIYDADGTSWGTVERCP